LPLSPFREGKKKGIEKKKKKKKKEGRLSLSHTGKLKGNGAARKKSQHLKFRLYWFGN
jgi:hypothetical protein